MSLWNPESRGDDLTESDDEMRVAMRQIVGVLVGVLVADRAFVSIYVPVGEVEFRH